MSITLLGTVIAYIVLGFTSALCMFFVGCSLAGIMGANMDVSMAHMADINRPENRPLARYRNAGSEYWAGFNFRPSNHTEVFCAEAIATTPISIYQL